MFKQNLFLSRLTFAAAREGQMPHLLSYISVKRLTPSPAILVNVRYSSKFLFIRKRKELPRITLFSAFNSKLNKKYNLVITYIK